MTPPILPPPLPPYWLPRPSLGVSLVLVDLLLVVATVVVGDNRSPTDCVIQV